MQCGMHISTYKAIIINNLGNLDPSCSVRPIHELFRPFVLPLFMHIPSRDCQPLEVIVKTSISRTQWVTRIWKSTNYLYTN